MAKVSTSKKAKRTWDENEFLIAEGILSLTQQGYNPGSVRAATIHRKTSIDQDVVQDHLRGDRFFERNFKKIVSDFTSRIEAISNPDIFAPVFLSCIAENEIFFQIELAQESHKLFSGVMRTLEPQITKSWSPQTTERREIFYRLYCVEVYTTLEKWLRDGVSQRDDRVTERLLTKQLEAFSTGQINTISALVFYEVSP